MLRSMYAGVSGMGAHMEKMDVIGNNISNVNTTGFKGSRATFQTMLSQTMEGGAAPQDGRGGTNPRQVGLGTTLGSIDKNMEQGNLESTGKNTDLAIEGDGFFILNDGGSNYYSRAGNTDFDEQGNLVNTSSGYKVQGWTADSQGRINTNEDIGDISLQQSMDAEATDEIEFDGNLSSDTYEWSTSFEFPDGADETATIDITYEDTGERDEDGNQIWDYSIDSVSNGEITDNHENRNGEVVVQEEDGEYRIIDDLPNTDLTFPEITVDGDSQELELGDLPGHTDQNPFRTGAYQVSDEVFDSQGNKHDVRVDFERASSNNWLYTVNVNGNEILSDSGPVAFDESGNVTGGGIDTLTADSDEVPELDGVGDLNITLDFEDMTQFSGAHSAEIGRVTGYEAGDLESFNIDGSGTITGNYDNGMQLSLARVATANFSNPGGLSEEGNSLFSESNNSGTARIGAPGTGGRGSITAGTLEMSNVDLSREFTDMITTQRGFQGNSTTITTADEILQEVVNMKR